MAGGAAGGSGDGEKLLADGLRVEEMRCGGPEVAGVVAVNTGE